MVGFNASFGPNTPTAFVPDRRTEAIGTRYFFRRGLRGWKKRGKKGGKR